MPKVLLTVICLLLPVLTTIPVMCFGQDSAAIYQRGSSDETEGTVVSSSRETTVVKTSDNQFQLFVFDQDTQKPLTLPVGTHVRLAYTSTDEPGVRLATNVTVLDAAPSQQAGAPGTKQAPPPPAVRNLESEIQKQVRHYRIGIRVGAALDPELFLFGIHSQLGPIFNRNVSFRPNAEFAFGEVTDLIALNLEATYRLPISSRQGRWSSYVGAGPALNFIHQSFQTSQGSGRTISFGNFEYQTGFNILTGLQFRRGTFVEVKSSLWSRPAPILRLIVGYTF
jgi:hypothetical protein